MKHILLLLVLALFTFTAKGQDFTPYGDSMVLQRSANTKISGTTKPNVKITITLEKQGDIVAQRNVKSDTNGRFITTLNLKEYGTGYTLHIGEKSYTNIAIGEVWLLSGQSNMAWQLFQSNEANTFKDDSDVRLLLYKPTFEVVRVGMTAEQLDDINRLTPYAQTSGWQEAKGDAAQQFSAIGMFFAANLRQKMPNVPIGLIQTAMGGAPIEAFLPRPVIDKDTALMKVLDGDWRDNVNINEWCRSIGKANLEGINDLFNQRHYFMPSYLYDTRIEPLKNTTIKGVLWYQGESNADNIPLHDAAFKALIYSWREAFKQPEMPFYFVQLSSHNRDAWPAFRNSQRLLANKIENCEMIVSHDHGNPTDVHPRDKKPIGERLAAVVLNNNYGIISPCHFPQVESYHNGVLTLKNCYDGLKTSDNAPVRGLEVSVDGREYHPVTATLEENKILMSDVINARYIRYAWSPSTDANIVNSASLPLSTFTLDTDN